MGKGYISHNISFFVSENKFIEMLLMGVEISLQRSVSFMKPYTQVNILEKASKLIKP